LKFGSWRRRLREFILEKSYIFYKINLVVEKSIHTFAARKRKAERSLRD
jgi:hypothetical protein